MSTLASTRHTLNLALNPASALLRQRQRSTDGGLTTSATSLLRPTNDFKLQNNMHPDCLLLPKHGVTSPRLSVSSASSGGGGGGGACRSNTEIMDNAKDDGAGSVQIDDDDATTIEMQESFGGDEDTSVVSVVADADIDADDDDDDVIVHEESTPIVIDECNAVDDVEDDVSCCSEGSVLSVGQEREQVLAANGGQDLLNVSRQQLLMSTLYRPSAFSSVGNTLMDTMHSEHTPSLSDVAHAHSAIIDPLAVVNALRAGPAAAAAAAAAATTATPISPFQEEFLRKSQIYAEELMKQQMQLMAAARVNVLTLRNAAAAGRMPPGVLPLQLRPTATLPSPAGIQTQLSAISKMTQYLATGGGVGGGVAPHSAAAGISPGTDALAKLTATALGIAPTHGRSYDKLPFQLQHDNDNNNLNESALKFSIDNILKADFGVRPASGDSTSTRNSSPISTVAAAPVPTTAARGRKTKATTVAANKPLNLAATTICSSYSSTLANICTNSNDSAASSACGGVGNFAADLTKSPSSLEADGNTNATTTTTTTAAGTTSNSESSSSSNATGSNTPMVWPAWVYCTRYSDRPSSGRSPRTRKPKKSASSTNGGGGSGGTAAGAAGDKSDGDTGSNNNGPEDKRPRTAFSGSQLARLKHEFNENRYLTEKRRQQLSSELGLNEAQIKIWFQNKRAKLKKSSGTKNPLALQLMAQGLYNHSTVPLTREEEELQELQEREMQQASGAGATSPAT